MLNYLEETDALTILPHSVTFAHRKDRQVTVLPLDIPQPPRSLGILRARELGFSIDEIRGLLDLVDGGTQTCAEVKERTERHLADIRAKIADLKRIEQVLAATAAQCSGEDVPECPVLEALAS